MKRKETSKAKLFDFKVACETELGRSVPPGTVVDQISSPYCGRHGSALGTDTLDVFEGTDLIFSAVLYIEIYLDLPVDLLQCRFLPPVPRNMCTGSTYR